MKLTKANKKYIKEQKLESREIKIEQLKLGIQTRVKEYARGKKYNFAAKQCEEFFCELNNFLKMFIQIFGSGDMLFEVLKEKGLCLMNGKSYYDKLPTYLEEKCHLRIDINQVNQDFGYVKWGHKAMNKIMQKNIIDELSAAVDQQPGMIIAPNLNPMASVMPQQMSMAAPQASLISPLISTNFGGILQPPQMIVPEQMQFSDLFYTQDSVKSKFRDGKSIFTANSHLNEAVKITQYQEKFYILSNRTAISKEISGAKSTKVELIPYSQCKKEFKSKNTGNGGRPNVLFQNQSSLTLDICLYQLDQLERFQMGRTFELLTDPISNTKQANFRMSGNYLIENFDHLRRIKNQ